MQVGPVERAVPVLLSAHDEAALRARAAAVAGVEAPAVAVAGALGRLAGLRVRWATVAGGRGALGARLGAFGRGEGAAAVAAARPGVVFAFTGQGTQWAGMARDLLARPGAFRAAFFAFAGLVADAGGRRSGRWWRIRRGRRRRCSRWWWRFSSGSWRRWPRWGWRHRWCWGIAWGS
ncbi:MAG: hypothetical protein R3F65_11125 [bacterium]